jgi:hypothetical protein
MIRMNDFVNSFVWSQQNRFCLERTRCRSQFVTKALNLPQRFNHYLLHVKFTFLSVPCTAVGAVEAVEGEVWYVLAYSYLVYVARLQLEI